MGVPVRPRLRRRSRALGRDPAGHGRAGDAHAAVPALRRGRRWWEAGGGLRGAAARYVEGSA